MSGLPARRWIAHRPEDTESLGAAFSRSIPGAGEQALIVHLIGTLGAGKTTWARGFLQALGVSRVRSPTFALLEVYELPAVTVAHLDLYRLTGAPEIAGLGLPDLDAPAHLWLIEWPERAGNTLPPPDLTISLRDGVSPGRIVQAAASSPLGADWLRAAVVPDATLMQETSQG